MSSIILNNIVKETKHCISPTSKALGLMFTKEQDRALVFPFTKETRVSLHMFFVFYPIDVLFLDESKKVTALKENFRPFTFHNPQKKCKYVIELPRGTINKHSIELGSELSF